MTNETRPTHNDLRNLRVNQTVMVRTGTNAREINLIVRFVSENFIGLQGMRGGHKNLVPSTCGKAVQLTTVSGQREWVTSLRALPCKW